MKYRLAILFPVIIFLGEFLLIILAGSKSGGLGISISIPLFMLPAFIILGEDSSQLLFIIFDLVLIVPFLSLMGYWIDRKIKGRSAEESRIMTKKQFVILIIILAAVEILIYSHPKFYFYNKLFIDYHVQPGVYYER